jgi:hypothetical protein
LGDQGVRARITPAEKETVVTNTSDWENGGPEMDRRGALECMVWDDEIVVTKPGTAFLLGYRKSAGEPRLVLTRSRVSPAASISEFRAQAFQAAASKARELGWIV